MTFLFTTDLHGDPRKYDIVFQFAEKNSIKLIHLGADLLPKGSDILGSQKRFVNGFLQGFYANCYSKGITVLAHFGNDDCYSRMKYFTKYGKLLDRTSYEVDDLKFIAYGFVPDYPFALKTACKLDYRGWKRPYVSHAIDVSDKGFVNVPDVDKYLEEKTTIEEDLKKIKGGPNVIMSCHCPPSSVDLDVCVDGHRVGSKSLFDWIEREQPAMVLCGHIHENFYVTKTWKVAIGRTIVIQPGQGIPDGKTHVVLVDVDGLRNIRSEIWQL